MRAKAILTAALAAGVLLLAPGLDGARADQNHRQGHGHPHAAQGKGHAYGWHGQRYFTDKRSGGGYAYGQRTRSYDGDLSRKDRKTLRQIRQRFDNEREFRRFLRHKKPGLYARYVDPRRHRPDARNTWRRQGDNDQAHKTKRAQRHYGYRGQTLRYR
jgi:hypothetical protein